jgi:hypothetical protein
MLLIEAIEEPNDQDLPKTYAGEKAHCEVLCMYFMMFVVHSVLNVVWTLT